VDKIKQFFSSAWANIVWILGGIIAILLYIMNLKDKKNNELQAKIDLAGTQKEADLIEVDIKNRLQQADLSQKEINNLNDNLAQLEEKRKQIENNNKSVSSKDAEDYWDNK